MLGAFSQCECEHSCPGNRGLGRQLLPDASALSVAPTHAAGGAVARTTSYVQHRVGHVLLPGLHLQLSLIPALFWCCRWGTCLGHQLQMIMTANVDFNDLLVPTDAVVSLFCFE